MQGLLFREAHSPRESNFCTILYSIICTITTAAWRTKPSWMLVAGKDRTIHPDLERWYAKRANSHTVEIPGASHVVYVSRPAEVAALIQEAASTLSKKP